VARRRARRGERRGGPSEPAAPIPLDPVDLLAGLAPGVELRADTRAPGDAGGGAAPTTVAETGRLLRSGDATIRRLIRSAVLTPGETRAEPGERAEPERAGVPPRSRKRPGE
jgi:hypothetical protein